MCLLRHGGACRRIFDGLSFRSFLVGMVVCAASDRIFASPNCGNSFLAIFDHRLHCVVQDRLAKSMGRCIFPVVRILQCLHHDGVYRLGTYRRGNGAPVGMEARCMDGSGHLHRLSRALADFYVLGFHEAESRPSENTYSTH